MNAAIDNYLNAAIAASEELYDPECALIGGFSPARYTEEYLRQYFNNPGERGLHNFSASLAYALSLQTMNVMPQRVAAILEAFFTGGVMSGNQLKWFMEEKCVRDRNANFFNLVPLLTLSHVFGDKLPPQMSAKCRSLLSDLYYIFASECGESSLTYVNPTLGRYAACALLAEKFHPAEFDTACRNFSDYADFLLHFGMNECNSPAYYVVDIQILTMILAISSAQALRTAASGLLDKIFLPETAFFGTRFPTPYRRGYNGDYAAERHDLPMSLFGWSDEFNFNKQDPYLCLLLPPLLKLSGVSCQKNEEFPRSQTLHIGDGCHALSFLDRAYLLGAFDKYPPVTTVWQTVDIGGSGWQDGPLFFSMENSSHSSGILRLEAIDAAGNERLHPNSGDYNMAKMQRIYPWRSFPPEPKLRTSLERNNLLCLWKIDRIDAELQRFGFNLHFSRFRGEIRDMAGEKVVAGYHSGPLILLPGDNIFCAIYPLRRTNMAGSTLLHSSGWLEPGFTVRRHGDNLECAMYHCDSETAGSYVLNHQSGGFYLRMGYGMSADEFFALARKIEIEDTMHSDRINAHIDERDAIREVRVHTPDANLSLDWNFYLPC